MGSTGSIGGTCSWQQLPPGYAGLKQQRHRAAHHGAHHAAPCPSGVIQIAPSPARFRPAALIYLKFRAVIKR